jgi:hypothetical protein
LTARALAEALLVGAGFLVVALALGGPLALLLERVESRILGRPPECAVRPLPAGLGGALLIGLGAEATLGVVLGLLGILSAPSLLACALGALLVGYGTLRRRLRRVLQPGRRPRDRLATAFLAVAVPLYLLRVAAALSPPHEWDEMAYHLPEAELIATSGTLPLTVGEHYFYGNLPKLVEVLHAEAVILSGVDAPHIVHVALLGAFLLFVLGTIASMAGHRAGALAVLLLLLYDQLVWNATTARIDAAVVSFEIAALLSAAVFAGARRPGDAGLAAAFIGFAAAAKYGALATLAFVAILLLAAALVHCRRRLVPVARLAAFLTTILLATAGFWYVKNLVRFGNPTYPLLFGHPGVDEQRYRGLVAAIQAFGPRTVWDFLAFPSRFATPQDFLLLLSLVVSPLAVLVRRHRVVFVALLLHLAWYSAYWFFLGSHQLRFFMPAGVTATILAAVAVTCAPARTLPIAGFVAAFTAFVAFPHVGRTLVLSPHEVGAHKLEASRLPYALGLESREEFLAKKLGCQYRVIRYLERTGRSGNVIDNWSVWHDTPATFYARRNRFVQFTSDSRDPEVVFSELDRAGVRFLYFRPETKRRFAQSTDPEVAAYRAGRDEVEEIVLSRADLLVEIDDCRLYALRPPRAGGP